MKADRPQSYLYSEADLLSLENGGLGGFPYTNPAKSRHARREKLRYVGKEWINNPQERERVQGIIKKTAKNTRVKTSSSWIRDKIAPYVEKAVYYLNWLFAKESGYIADYGTVKIEEMKEDPYIRDRKGRIIGKIRGVYKRPTDDIGLNPQLKAEEHPEGLETCVHELHHEGREYMGENGECQEVLGPFAVPVIEAKTRLATDIVGRHLYRDRIIEKYLGMPRSRLPRA